MSYEDIQKQGANARAMDLKLIDNPFYLSKNMPAATGETMVEWESKAAAWEIGWRVEDLMRS